MIVAARRVVSANVRRHDAAISDQWTADHGVTRTDVEAPPGSNADIMNASSGPRLKLNVEQARP